MKFVIIKHNKLTGAKIKNCFENRTFFYIYIILQSKCKIFVLFLH